MNKSLNWLSFLLRLLFSFCVPLSRKKPPAFESAEKQAPGFSCLGRQMSVRDAGGRYGVAGYGWLQSSAAAAAGYRYLVDVTTCMCHSDVCVRVCQNAIDIGFVCPWC